MRILKGTEQWQMVDPRLMENTIRGERWGPTGHRQCNDNACDMEGNYSGPNHQSHISQHCMTCGELLPDHFSGCEELVRGV
eukprot:g57446.t1